MIYILNKTYSNYGELYDSPGSPRLFFILTS